MASAAQDDLLDFVSSVAGEGSLRVEESLGHGYVRLRVAEAERRQAKHDIRHVEDAVIETLRNARDAGARHVYLASSREGSMRTLVVLDDGCGIPDDMVERVFEARVTSKLESMAFDRWGIHGRGMALYSIRQNLAEARVAASGLSLGTSVLMRADCTALPERADQSTLPALLADEDGRPCLGPGPHNIARCVLEFALSCEDRVQVYLGSPAEIAATLYERNPAGISLRDLLFTLKGDEVPVCSRLCAAADAEDLSGRAAGIGLVISPRTSQRILSREITPLRPALTRLHGEKARSKPTNQINLEQDRRGLHISRSDVSEFQDDLRRAFDPLARRYYMALTAPPRVKVGQNCITVTFPIEKQ